MEINKEKYEWIQACKNDLHLLPKLKRISKYKTSKCEDCKKRVDTESLFVVNNKKEELKINCKDCTLTQILKNKVKRWTTINMLE